MEQPPVHGLDVGEAVNLRESEIYRRLQKGDPALTNNYERQLLSLKDLLYEGNWREMFHDLRTRRDTKPHHPKLFARIDEDIERVRAFIRLEQEGIQYFFGEHEKKCCVRTLPVSSESSYPPLS